MKNKKLLFSFGIIALLIIAAIGLYKNRQQTSDANVTRIGVLSFLTGTYAQMGIEIQNGAILAKDVFCQNNKSVVELVSEDGKGEAKPAVSAFNKLLLSKPDAVLVAGANQVPVTAPIAAKVGVPMLATVIPNSEFLSYNGENTLLFRNFASSAAMARKIAQFAVQQNMKSVSCIMIRASVGEESLSSFVGEFEHSGGKILTTESFDETMSSIQGIVTKSVSGNPDAIYVVGYGSVYAMLLNEIKNIGYKGRILTNDAVASPETLEILKNKDMIFYSDLDFVVRPEYKNVLNYYKEKYGTEMSPFAIYGYNTFMILAEAAFVAKKESIHIEKVLLRNEGFDTLTGKISFRKNGDCELPITIKEMK